MALLEVLTVKLGGALTRSLLKAWLEDHPLAADVSTTSASLLERLVPDAVERRSKRRQLEHIELECAKRLNAFIEAEFRGLPENDRLAAIEAAAHTLDMLPMQLSTVARCDFEPSRVEALIHAQRPTATTDDALGEAGGALYGFLIREASHYIVEISTTLPDFLKSTQIESLQREAEILTLVQQILDNLPRPPSAVKDPDEDFESEYRRYLARTLDELELFGVDLRPESKRYALSVAYITLSASRRRAANETSDNKGRPKGDGTDTVVSSLPPSAKPLEDDNDEMTSQVVIDGADDDDIALERVDELLAGRQRLLIRGEAGSGKTTLLRWLAVQASRRAFEEPLEEYNERVPLVIILRQYAKRDLPPPEAFLESVAATIAGGMPSGWVNRLLGSGRALVLVDGVDELPVDRREQARQWLDDLTQAYPDVPYVVTSRPPAAKEDWLDGLNFDTAELQPMGIADIHSFIEHWYDAALKDVAEHERAEAESMRRKLQATIAERRPLRNLATSPLLCALLCALNRDRRARLPEDRTELYRVALEALLQRRDEERDAAVDDTALPLRQKLLLLQDIAFWMIAEGRSDASEDEVLARIGRRAGDLRAQGLSAERIYRTLLERSGVLRAPVSGRVDFLHRTFEEYLAAAEALEGDYLNLLVRHAHLDQWREVVILAAGQAHRTQRETLISGLLQRGHDEEAERSTLHLLAVACLEASPEISPELEQEIAAVLRTLIPPSNMTEASALSSAGDLCVPLMAEFTAAGARVAAACVRTLGLIGTESAMNAIAMYAPDPRKTVLREIVRAWSNYDPDAYVERVLRHVRPRTRILELREPSLFRFADRFELVRAVALCFAGKVDSLDFLDGRKAIDTLDVNGCPTISDLSPLALHPEIVTLSLAECSAVQNVFPLGQVTHLRNLNLSGTAVSDLRPLRACERLRDLRLVGCRGLEQLDGVPLESLDTLVADFSGLRDIDELAGASQLRTLFVRYIPAVDIGVLATIPKLSYLMLDGIKGIQSLDFIAGSDRLVRLDIDDLNVETTTGLGPYESLQFLSAQGCGNLVDIEMVRKSPRLSFIDCSGCSSLQDISPLAGKRGLVHVVLQGTQVRDLTPLASLPRLQRLDLGSTPLDDLAPLEDLRALRRLNLDGAQVGDLSVLERLPNLAWVSLRETDVDVSSLRLGQRTLRIVGPEATEQWLVRNGELERWRPRPPLPTGR